MLVPTTWISTAIEGYKWLRLWHDQQDAPVYFPRHAVLVFKAFREAYERKDIDRLAAILAEDYQGDVFGVRTKDELLSVQRQVFCRLPWWVYPCLSVNVYSILEDQASVFRAIIDTNSYASVLGVPVYTCDSAPLRCEIQPRGEHRIWQVTQMFVHQELVKR